MRRLTVLILLLVFALCVYRAFTQSLACDEAFTYRNYLHGPFADLIASYDANNHVLFSLLARLSTLVFGFSEWAIRLPALVGAALYLAGVYRLVLFLHSTRARVVAILLLCLHPYILDFLAAARGYALALGFFLFAVVDILEAPDLLRWRTGVFLGLAIGSNLTFLFPVLALIATLIGTRSWDAILDRIAGPCVVVAALIVILPLTRAAPDQFYYGAHSLRETWDSMLHVSVMHGGWLDQMPAVVQSVYDLMPPLLTGLLVFAAIIAILDRSRPIATIALTLLLSLAFTMLAHVIAATPYPRDRTGFGLLLLTLIGIALATDRFVYAGRAVATLACVCGLFFVTQIDPRYFMEWRYDASTRRVVQKLTAITSDHVPRRVGLSWDLQPSFAYYRDKLGSTWLTASNQLGPPPPGMDLYVLDESDRKYIRAMTLSTIYADPLSGAAICKARVQ